MPRDHPYRMLMVSGLKTTLNPHEVISKIKLSCDADHHIEFNDYVEDLYDMNEQRFGFAQQVKTLYKANDGVALMDLYNTRKAHIYCDTADYIATIQNIDAEQLTINLYDMTTPGTPSLEVTAQPTVVDIEGLCPSAFVCYPFGDPDVEDSWFNAPTFGDIKLKLTQVIAAGACEVVLQQIRI